ncbi:hypothetical protein [Oribacterium sp. FC2011]|uniref:hypothetical protein n=1 Tax=Oribacterium sp. FC2011 TaxID=1408311 RepID=UPI0004E1D64B|nr:hypothetical protein [Oribacterium sp. FC2011]
MNRIKNQILLNIFIIFAGIVFAFVLLIGNVGRISANVAVVPGSFGEQYAKDNKLNIAEISDSEKGYFDQRYETFDYLVDGDEITIERYNGESTSLVIPSAIGNKTVTVIGDDFFKSITNVKKLYIPPTVTKIQGDVDESITIFCYDNTPVYKQYIADKEAKLKETEKETSESENSTAAEDTTETNPASDDDNKEEKEWNYELLYDSEFVNYQLGDIPFEYNTSGVTVDITRYTGKDDMIVIPSYIDGHPVTSISMNLLGTAKLIVIPDTVNSITGTSGKFLYSPVFAIELLFSLIAIILSLLTVNILLPRYSKDNSEYLLTGGRVVSVVLYALAQIGFAIAAIYYISVTPFFAIVISLIIITVFVLFVFSAGIGRQHAKAVTKKIEEKTSRMDAIKQSAKLLDDSISDPVIKMKVTRLMEEIRYSDPVSTSDLDGIEYKLELSLGDVKTAIDNGDTEGIIKAVDDTMHILKERNALCKAGK